MTLWAHPVGRGDGTLAQGLASRSLSAVRGGFPRHRPRSSERRRNRNLTQKAVEVIVLLTQVELVVRAVGHQDGGQAMAGDHHQSHEIVGKKREMVTASYEMVMTLEPKPDKFFRQWWEPTAGVEQRRCRGGALPLLGLPSQTAGRPSPRPRDGNISSTTKRGSCNGSDLRANPCTTSCRSRLIGESTSGVRLQYVSKNSRGAY